MLTSSRSLFVFNYILATEMCALTTVSGDFGRNQLLRGLVCRTAAYRQLLQRVKILTRLQQTPTPVSCLLRSDSDWLLGMLPMMILN